MSIDYIIRKIIETENNITIDRLMRELLIQNIGSYYKSSNILGANVDFITAPEISQLFGEVIGFWAYEEWNKLGRPNNINIVELGGGNGLFMRNFLRVAKLLPEFYSAIRVEIVELNPYFIKKQKNIISQYDVNFNFLNDINQIKHVNTIFIANKFFDLLPIKQYINSKSLWYERIISTDPIDSKIIFDKMQVKNLLQESLSREHPNARDGSIFEESYDSINIMQTICKHLTKYGGASLIIDYGYYINPNNRTSYQYNSTIQSLKNNQYCSLLENLGSSDISAHVNFMELQEIAQRNYILSHFTSQRKFLIDNGLIARSENFKKSLNEQDSFLLDKEVTRLISPNQMGELFKVLICSKSVK